ncbi:hypothetical protein HQ961_02320 [Enterococcus faecium]|nr:hypothetical protein [Enterococcus faecium]NTR84999.1 hypothetical protein [Enterococcus faecium]NTS03340.1 hypothetical protein [Enterococcus faecium]
MKIGIDNLSEKKKEITDSFSKKLLFSQFIPERVKYEVKKYEAYYSSYLVFGESGTAKKKYRLPNLSKSD